MTALDRVTAALRASGSTEHRGGTWNCPGPLHQNGDRKPSLHVTTNGNGAALHCFTGCSTEDITDMIGLTMSELFEEPPARREVARYKYTDLSGEVLFAKVRYDPKDFAIYHPNGSGWEKGIGNAERVLYRLPELVSAVSRGDLVYLTEGEKDADRIALSGVCATTNFEGAGKWRQEYTRWLSGADVIIIADRDDAGVAHALKVAEALKGHAKSTRIVQSRTEGRKHDASDHLDAGYSLDQLVPYRPESEITRRYIPVNWADAFKTQPDDVRWLVEDFIEAGTLNAIYSAPGVGKSLLALEVAVEIVRSGKTVLYVDQENRITDTVERLSSFGVRPDELDRLLMYSFPSLPPLDTLEGGQHIVSLAAVTEPSLIILDTLSRMVAGAENDADTYLALYRNTLAPLKGRGIATLRLDHSGKNESAGQRGSSSKSGDIDVLWWLHRDGETAFSLECQKSRSGHIPFGTVINLSREYDPLRHEWHVRVDMPLSRYEAVMRQMDNLGISPSLGRDAVRKIFRDNNVTGVRNDQLQAAITERRNRQGRFAPMTGDNWGRGDR